MSQSETSVAGYRFDGVYLDVRNRQVWRGGQVFPLNSKYFEALLLLVRERGRLMEKRRLFDEVWEGVPVTDAALTQCIKDIRRQLGDDAANPRYIKTVPKHGYVFIFDGVEVVPDSGETTPELPRRPAAEGFGQAQEVSGRVGARAMEGLGGMMGGGIAGVMGGLMLGGGLAMARHAPVSEAVSLIFVMIGLGTFIGVAGGLWVSGGMAVGGHLGRGWGTVAGAIAGGMVVGGIAQFLGVDALRALFGHRLTGITGAFEGAAIGAGVSMGGLAGGWRTERRWGPLVGGAAGTMCAAILLTLAGRTLFSGSLEILARAFADSQIGLDPISRLFGEEAFGRVTQVALGAVEGALFGAGVTGGMTVASRRSQVPSRKSQVPSRKADVFTEDRP